MRLVRLVVAAAAWAAALACVPHPSSDPVCDGSEVTGSHLITFVTDTGEAKRAFKPSTNVNALLPLPGAGRGYVACNGSESNGNLSVGNVPDGPWVMQVDTTYAFTAQRNIDLGEAFLGRPVDTINFPSAPTPLRITAGQMDAWTTDDHLELFSSNARFFLFDPDQVTGATGAPTGGATSLDLTVDWNQLQVYNPLIEGSAGDTLFVNQMEKTDLTVGTGNGLSLVKQLTTSPNMSDGSAATSSGPFVLLPSVGFTTTWSRGGFHSQKDAMAGDSGTPEQDFLITANPEGNQRGWFDLSMGLFSTSFQTPAGDDVTLGVTFGRPPPKYDAIVVVRELFPVMRFGEEIDGLVQQETAMDVNTIAAQCAVVRGPQLDGHDLQGTSSSPMVGETPSVSWTMPMPAPDAVRIFVQHPSVKGGHDNVAQIILPTSVDMGARTHVDIPPHVLVSGEQYYLLIDAVTSPGWDAQTTPLQPQMPICLARFVSQPFSVSF